MSKFQVIILLLLLKITTPLPVQDPEFEEYDNWLQRNRSILMMKQLPKNANYTWKQYFASWNMVYEKEMARKELSFEAAEFIENTLSTIDFTIPSAIYFGVYIKTCPNRTGWYELEKRNEEVSNDFRIHNIWSAEYCGSEMIGEWCEMGNRLSIKMKGNLTFKNVLHGANVTFTCPFSTYHAVRDAIIVETKDSWHFSQLFYISVIVLILCILIGIVVFILVLCERRDRKLSQMACNDHWPTYTKDYYRFDTPADTPEEVGHNHIEPEVSSDESDFVPVRK